MALKDSSMLKLAKQHKELKKEIEAKEAEANKIRDRIVRSMEEKGLEAVEGEGVRIKYVQAEEVTYDVKVLQRHLPKEVFEKVTTRVVDKEALSYQVQKKRVPKEVVLEAAEVKTKAPFIRVTILKED